jgi:hypothetical protein
MQRLETIRVSVCEVYGWLKCRLGGWSNLQKHHVEALCLLGHIHSLKVS